LIHNRLLGNSIYTGVALFFVGIVPFIFNIFVARYFGKEELGQINISLSFCLLITIFVTNFFGTTSNKFLSEYRGRGELDPFNIVLLFSFLGPLLTNTIIIFLIFNFWDLISIKFSLNKSMLTPMIFYILGRTYYIIVRKVFYGVNLIANYTIIEIIADMIILLSIFTICYLGSSSLILYSFTFGYLIFSFLGLIIIFLKYDIITNSLKPIKTFNPKIIFKKYSKYGFITMIGNASSAGASYVAMLFIAAYLSNSEAGVYSSVLAVISIVMFIPRLFSQVLLPEFSNLFGSGKIELLKNTLIISSLFLSIIGVIVILPLFIFSSHILSLFGNSFSDGSQILRIMTPAVLIRIISVPIVTFLSSTKYVIYPNIGGVIILITSVIAWIILTPAYKLNGIAFGYLIGTTIGIGYQIITGLIKFNLYTKNLGSNYNGQSIKNN